MYSYNPDKSCIVSINFKDGMRAITDNPYSKNIVMTQGLINIIEGKLITDNELLAIIKLLSKTFSIRIVMKVNALPSSGVSSIAATIANESLFSFNTSGVISSVGTNLKYVNGAIGTNVTVGETKEYVITTSNTALKVITQLFGNNAGSYLNAAVEKVEIYNRVLSAAEIKNMYEGKTFMPFEDSSEIVKLFVARGVIVNKYNTSIVNSLLTVVKSYINVPKNTDFSNCYILYSINNKNNWTQCAWIKPKSIGGINNTIMPYMDQIPLGYKQNTTSAIQVVVRNTFNNTNTANVNKWYHFSSVYDAGILKIYINGILVYTSPNIAPITTHDGRLTFYNNINGYYINMFRLFDNKSISAQEVAQIYTSERKILSL